ncbi:Rieske (2Fe-2S) protein [Streptomyces sp. NPDC059928]|uniref:Rieske (2Fe-2S) protein n=1 Tax=unclassified Streptomyces TaxID=2593676 RepID=UPI0036534DE8
MTFRHLACRLLAGQRRSFLVLVVRERDGEFHVLVDRCSHMAGSLSQRKVADGRVECPWHGSVFRLADGRNVGGPATASQPTFETRPLVQGVLEVRLPGVVRAPADPWVTTELSPP